MSRKGKEKSKKKHKELQKRQKRNRISQKKQAKIELIPRRLTSEELEEWKEKLQPAVDEANQRIRNLFTNGLTTTYLEKLAEGRETFRFEIDDIESANELRTVMTQVRVFLNDLGDTNDKAILQTAMLNAELYRGQFGNQYGKRHFNIESVIDEAGRLKREGINPEIAKRAFAAYRRLEESWAAVIGRQGQEGVYGSENLIIALYDIEARGMDSLDFGRDLLEAFENETLKEWENIMPSISKAEEIIMSWDNFWRRNF